MTVTSYPPLAGIGEHTDDKWFGEPIAGLSARVCLSLSPHLAGEVFGNYRDLAVAATSFPLYSPGHGAHPLEAECMNHEMAERIGMCLEPAYQTPMSANLLFNPTASRLKAVTSSRGVWEIEIP